MTGAFAHDFPLDRFQQEAIAGLDAGRNVLVSAPTGSGKTVVGEHAVALALRDGGKAFYTAPIKALSNQKYADLVAELGPERVGLLTGDHAVNPGAPVVVMTTEVLRNMVYAGSSSLRGLQWVVLDEVHFLQDAYRGPVWEEVLIHTPASVRFVCLSATVSNAAELGEWVAELRGPTDTVVEHVRPIRLDSLYMVGDRSSERDHLVPVLVDGRPNPEGDRFDADRGRPGGPRQRPGRQGPSRYRSRFRTPRRLEVVERLDDEDLLPAIYFIFSRAACTDAANHCLEAGLRLTDAAERSRIRALAEGRVASLSDADLDVLGYDQWLATLEAGVAAHHAGMIPAFREAVEDCFAEGLIKVVFATETLALGINMPARSVVIEKLTKYNGESHEFLTPAQFTQLTGRAGRRGIDDQGTSVVLWSPFVTFAQVARLAASREFPLASAFRPTYNMAANLVHRYDREVAHSVLARSFAQFQADRAAVQLQTRVDRLTGELDLLGGPPEGAEDDAVASYVAALDEVAATRPRRGDRRALIETSLASLRPGDVIERPTRDGRRLLLVLSVAFRKGGAVRVRTVTAQGTDVELRAADLDAPVSPIATVDLPVPFEPRRADYRRDAAAVLRRTNLRRAGNRKGGRRGDDEWEGVDDDALEAHLAARAAVEAHPLERRDDRDQVVARHRERARLAHDLSVARRRLDRRGSGLVKRFDAVLEVLARGGHTRGWSLTPSGERLRRIYHECDLLLSLALDDGLFDDLDAPGVAALASCVTYEHRSPEAPPPPQYPSQDVRRRAERLDDLCSRLNGWERAAKVPETRRPEPGFAAAAFAWADGRSLQAVLDDDMTGGDFVRNTKQLIDLLRQLGDVAPDPRTAAVCRRAADDLFRGVVEAGSEVS
ncbi:DEAD/DEAH box helicase [Dermatobacter hominis]|uniref:DEAD/DEAH box helicase n=1 Tax=Dermatobacter hominis TaxID=2884263 RepID=UPI001D114A71|nr:DEAD/DEAH box helicase [Dermatobacter hominis]UDY38025.1 DEAD/DEAH box helicase [Dermatobacter hominis]